MRTNRFHLMMLAVALIVSLQGLCRADIVPPATNPTPQQLLATMLTCHGTNLEAFVESQKAACADFETRLKEMVEYLKTLDEEQLLIILDQGYAKGWPSYFVAYLFGGPLVELRWKEKPPGAAQIFAQLDRTNVTQQYKYLMITASLYSLQQRWSEAEFLRLMEYACRYIAGGITNGAYKDEELGVVVSACLGRMDERLTKTQGHADINQLEQALAALVFNVLYQSNAMHETLIDVIQGYRIMHKHNLSAINSKMGRQIRTHMAALLFNTNTSDGIVTTILRMHNELGLATVLSAEQIDRLQSDSRFDSKEDRQILQDMRYECMKANRAK